MIAARIRQLDRSRPVHEAAIEENGRGLRHRFTWECRGGSEGEPELREPGSCIEWRWFSLDDLPEKLFEGTKYIIRNFKAGTIYQERRLVG